MKVPFFVSEKWGYWLATAGASLLFAVLGLMFYLDAGRDDTFITLWAGENLAKGLGLVNYNFERVEISSSLLHTLIVAVLARIGPECIFTLNKIVGLLAGVLILCLIGRSWKILYPWREYRLLAFCCVQISLSTMPSFLYWTLGGLETPFVTFLLLWIVVNFIYYWTRPTLGGEIRLLSAQIAFMLARPEAFYIIPFTLIFVVFHAWIHGWRWRLCRLLLVPAAVFIALGLFRLVHFGTFFPNPVYAKTTGLFRNIGHGVHYTFGFYTSSFFHFFLGAAFIAVVCYFFILLLRSFFKENLLKTRAEGPLIFVLGLSITVHLAVMLTGGDWMEHHRFMHPVTPLVVILSIGFAFRLIRRAEVEYFPKFATPDASRMLVLFMAAAILLSWIPQLGQSSRVTSWQGSNKIEVERTATDYSLTQLLDGDGGLDDRVKALSFRYRLVKEKVFPFLEGPFRELYRRSGRLVIASPQMGWFPYFLKNRYPEYDLYFIDTYGLCDQQVALLDMQGSAYGLKVGSRIMQIVAGKAGPLSEYVLSMKPNMLYSLYMNPQAVARMEALGYEAVSKESGALFFYKAGDL